MTRPGLFPRETLDWRAIDLPAWRGLTLSAVAMGVLVGVPLRLLRAWALGAWAPGTPPGPSFAFMAGVWAATAVLLCGAVALHLAHYPVRRWPWRLGAFLLVEVAAEIGTAAVLVALGREPLGSAARARWADLPGIVGWTLAWRVVLLVPFALVLAAVVQLVRGQLARRGRHHLHVEGGHVVRDAPPS